MLKYFLNAGIHLCIADGSAILLDLYRDRYLGLGPLETATLSRLVEGWPEHELSRQPHELPSGGLELARDMQREGLLTCSPEVGKSAAPVQLPIPTGSVVHLEGPSFTPADVYDFAMACTIASYLLKFTSMKRIAARIARRKARHDRLSLSDDSQDCLTLATKFISMRPLIFGARDECLFDSIALLEFLWRRHAVATWVLGVKVGPFSAHSWVQHEDVVLNDTMENALSFAPIFAV